MIDRFTELLNELSQVIGLSLQPDKKNACKLVINDQSHVQLECDTRLEKLLLATFIGPIPPGKFRENILKDALKCNYPFPVNGTLAYCERTNMLTLFSYLTLAPLNGHKLSEFLNHFLDKAHQWRAGLESGHTAQLVTSPNHSPKSPFG